MFVWCSRAAALASRRKRSRYVGLTSPWVGGAVRPGGLAGRLELLHDHQRREQLADLVGQFRVALGVLGQRRPLAAAKARREFLRQLLHWVPLCTRAGHGCTSLSRRAVG